jgi:hypothetical protein
MSRYPDKLFIVRSSVVTTKTTRSHDETSVERWLNEDAVRAHVAKLKGVGKQVSLHVKDFLTTGVETRVDL